jgi:hypothetical protein
MLEIDIENYLVKRVKEIGGEIRKVKWPGRNSAPDRVVMLPRGETAIWNSWTNTIWVELKPPGGKATFPKNAHERSQHREHERMRAVGQRVEVIDSFEGVDECLG